MGPEVSDLKFLCLGCRGGFKACSGFSGVWGLRYRALSVLGFRVSGFRGLRFRVVRVLKVQVDYGCKGSVGARARVVEG